MSKAELLERVWPGVFVTDASLARAVTEIRSAIGDCARNGRIIRTVHAYGYAFGAAVETVSAPANAARRPVCWLFNGTYNIGLPEGDHIVGREPAAAVRLDSPKVSRHHARLLVRRGSAIIEDLDSKNGSFVGGARVLKPTRLVSGDLVRIGPFTLTVGFADETASTETESITRHSK